MFTFVDGVASSLCSSILIFFSGDFIYKVSSQSPTRHFIIHSRKALLNGISPAENRSIPPLKYVMCTFTFKLTYVLVLLLLTKRNYWYQKNAQINENMQVIHCIYIICRYEYFYGLLRDFPDLRFTINGGINAIEEVNHNKLTFILYCSFLQGFPHDFSGK